SVSPFWAKLIQVEISFHKHTVVSTGEVIIITEYALLHIDGLWQQPPNVPAFFLSKKHVYQHFVGIQNIKSIWIYKTKIAFRGKVRLNFKHFAHDILSVHPILSIHARRAHGSFTCLHDQDTNYQKQC